MSDIVIQTELKLGMVPSLHQDLLAVFPLQPPPSARGKWIFAKYAQAIASELPKYIEHKHDLLRKYAPKDEKAEPILVVTDFGNGQSQVSIPTDHFKAHPEIQAAFVKEDLELSNTPLVLNLPQLTHTDLGACPIPQGVYTRLLGVLIKDEIPPENG